MRESLERVFKKPEILDQHRNDKRIELSVRRLGEGGIGSIIKGELGKLTDEQKAAAITIHAYHISGEARTFREGPHYQRVLEGIKKGLLKLPLQGPSHSFDTPGKMKILNIARKRDDFTLEHLYPLAGFLDAIRKNILKGGKRPEKGEGANYAGFADSFFEADREFGLTGKAGGGKFLSSIYLVNSQFSNDANRHVFEAHPIEFVRLLAVANKNKKQFPYAVKIFKRGKLRGGEFNFARALSDVMKSDPSKFRAVLEKLVPVLGTRQGAQAYREFIGKEAIRLGQIGLSRSTKVRYLGKKEEAIKFIRRKGAGMIADEMRGDIADFTDRFVSHYERKNLRPA